MFKITIEICNHMIVNFFPIVLRYVLRCFIEALSKTWTVPTTNDCAIIVSALFEII